MKIKNLLKALTFIGLFATLASCTQEDLADAALLDETNLASNELVTTTAKSMDSVGTGLTFDAKHRRHGWGGGRGSHPRNITGDSILFAGLPTAAQTYLTTNTDTSTITRIVRITLPDSTIQYIVRFSGRTHLHFDANGAVVTTPTHGHQFVDVLFTELPTAAQTYLNANVTVANISIIIKLTKPNGTEYYLVRMNDGTRITFDATGNVVPNDGSGRGRRGRHRR